MSTDFVEDIAPGPNSGLIEVLSYRTYPSLVSALREVVSNSSDADASKLNISLSRTYDIQLNKVVWKLTFFDDGEGMTLEEFKNYLRLSGSGRRDRTASDATPSGRPIIGMLGIGSLAIAPWADRVEILTKKDKAHRCSMFKYPMLSFSTTRVLEVKICTVSRASTGIVIGHSSCKIQKSQRLKMVSQSLI